MAMDLTEADDREIRESMSRFESALSAKEPQILDPRLGSILLALDGSNQDDTSARLALALARRHGSRVILLDLAEPSSPGARGRAPVEELEKAGVRVERAEGGDADRPAYERILEIREAHGADLIVVCAPFLDDFSRLRGESVGTNLDLLMSRSPVPLFITREPLSQPGTHLFRIVLPITPRHPKVVDAAAWALRTVAEDGELELLAVVDRDVIEAAGELADQLDEQTLAGLSHPETAGLVAALQRRAAEAGLDCRVSLRSGDPIPEITTAANAEDCIVVTASPRNPASSGYQRAQAIVRGSRNPVLVV